jgi:hypothetical protein
MLLVRGSDSNLLSLLKVYFARGSGTFKIVYVGLS